MPKFVSRPTQNEVALGPMHEQHRFDFSLVLSMLLLLHVGFKVFGGSFFII